MTTKTMTQAEALDWLAGLEQPCPDCHFQGERVQEYQLCTRCGGNESGLVPVLDLREPCNCWCHTAPLACCSDLTDKCWRCQGRLWIPKQGRDALHQAMHKDGWNRESRWIVGEEPLTCFTQHRPDDKWRYAWGEDTDDHIAAVKALQKAGYGAQVFAP